MKLTKEECLRLLNQIRYALDYHEVDESLYDNVEVLEQLINECFESSGLELNSEKTRSNPPLELENYLKRIQELELKEKQWIETEKDYRDEIKGLKSNPPLKFEELKVDMWVWDNKIKMYLKIEEIWHTKTIHFEGVCLVSKFEENRFYRREVQE